MSPLAITGLPTQFPAPCGYPALLSRIPSLQPRQHDAHPRKCVFLGSVGVFSSRSLSAHHSYLDWGSFTWHVRLLSSSLYTQDFLSIASIVDRLLLAEVTRVTRPYCSEDPR